MVTKNILYVMTALEGGAATGLHELLKGLDRRRYRAYIAISRPTDEEDIFRGFKEISEEIRYIPMSWWNINVKLSAIKKFLMWLIISAKTIFHIIPVITLCFYIKKRRIDLLYTVNSQLIDGALAARVCGLPHIWHVKEPVSSKLLARLIHYLSNRVILIGEFAGGIFRKHNLAPDAKVVREGVDLGAYPASGGLDLRRSLGIKNDELTVAMIGHILSMWKEHGLFIRMAGLLRKRFPKCKFVIFGKKPPDKGNILYNDTVKYGGALDDMVKKAGFSGNFIWAGYCKDIPAMMHSVDILIHPASREGFGRIAIEAMAAGRPVVGPDRGGITESVVDGVTGFLAKPGNAEDFARKTAKLLEDTELRKRTGAAGRLRVEKDFSLKRHVEEIENIYEELLGEGAHKSHRILYVVGGLGAGGLEGQLYHILRGIDREHLKPGVAAWSFNEDEAYVSKIRNLGVPIYGLGGRPVISKFINLRRLIKTIRPEIVHSFSFYTNFPVFLTSLGLGALCLGSVQNDFVTDRREEGFLLGRLSGRWPRKQIFNSLAASRNASSSGGLFRPAEHFVVKNGIDTERFKAHPIESHGRPCIAGIGSLTRRKRWDRLLNAVAGLKEEGFDFKIKIAGPGPMRGRLQEMTAALGVEDRVEFLGYRDDISCLLNEAAFVVHTADVEGRPNAIMEAMAAGRAVVAVSAGDVPDIVEDKKTGFVIRSTDAKGLIAAIKLLINDRSLCIKMGAAGRIKAERKFGFEQFSRDMLDAYRKAGWSDV